MPLNISSHSIIGISPGQVYYTHICLSNISQSSICLNLFNVQLITMHLQFTDQLIESLVEEDFKEWRWNEIESATDSNILYIGTCTTYIICSCQCTTVGTPHIMYVCSATGSTWEMLSIYKTVCNVDVGLHVLEIFLCQQTLNVTSKRKPLLHRCCHHRGSQLPQVSM